MLLPAIWFGSLCISLLFAWGVRLHDKKRHHPLALSHFAGGLGLFFTILFGFVLTPFFSRQLSTTLQKTKWPSVDGTIVASTVVGERAFRPDIRYEYLVNNKHYSGSSFLNMPGFGGRMNRLDAAEKLAKAFPAGSHIVVYYRPENPQESTLVPQPAYSYFIKIGTSTILFILGLILLFLWISQRLSKPLSDERS